MTSLERNLDCERQLLVQATAHIDGGAETYINAVLSQLDRFERHYGNTSWMSNTLRTLVDEMADKAAGFAGWGVGLDYRLAMARMDPGLRDQLRIRLIGALTMASVAWREITELGELLDDLTS